MTPKISYRSPNFMYEEWPDEPNPSAFVKTNNLRVDGWVDEVRFEDAMRDYELAKQSAIKAGVEFLNQDAVFKYLWYEDDKNPVSEKDFEPQDGQSFPAPEGVRVETQGCGWTSLTGEYSWQKLNNPKFTGQTRQVALLPKQEKPMNIPQMKVHYGSYKWANCPKSIPMGLLNEEWAQHNHDQSLQTLNDRGGMGICEIWANIAKARIDVLRENQATTDAIAKLAQNFYNRLQPPVPDLTEKKETRKQEIEKIALRWENDIPDDPVVQTLCGYILELTEPDTLPPTTGKEGLYWLPPDCREMTPGEEQEELLKEVWWHSASLTLNQFIHEMKSRFTLTRKPEGNEKK